MLWAKSSGGTNNDSGYGITTDDSGNVILTGIFSSSAITFGATTLSNAGDADIFLVKYNGTGNVLWATSAGGTIFDETYSVSTDASGNIIVTGCFSSPTIAFGSTILTNAGSYDVLLVKYNSLGNVLWARSAGGTNFDEGCSTATDAFGNIYVSGKLNSLVTIFGSDTLFYPTGAYDPMFIVKYGSSGSVLCTSALASGGDDQNTVATDVYGNVFVVGDYYGVNPFIVGMDSLPYTGSENVFVAKYFCETIEGVNELSTEEEINIYPNPATNQLTISSKHPDASGAIKSVEIWDVVGKKRLTLTLSKGEGTALIEVSKLASGIYFVKVRGEKQERVMKFVKQ